MRAAGDRVMFFKCPLQRPLNFWLCKFPKTVFYQCVDLDFSPASVAAAGQAAMCARASNSAAVAGSARERLPA
jgi:hypothetical protein